MSDPNRASYDPTPKEHITSISRQPRDCFTEAENCEHQPEPLRTEMKTSQPGIMSISWDAPVYLATWGPADTTNVHQVG